MEPIPEHLAIFPWYAPHLAWIRSSEGYNPRHDPGDAKPKQADLSETDLSEIDLHDADLTRARFYRTVMRGANLSGADLYHADLAYADLEGSDMTEANLMMTDMVGARLRNVCLKDANTPNTRLRGADLTGVTGTSKTPVVPDLHRRMLEVTRSSRSLDMENWHTCETTHCRAGWAIVLAGKEGEALEEELGANLAGSLIYFASTGEVPDFYTEDASARIDIQRCASRENP